MSLFDSIGVSKTKLRVLDFDCECRPLSWYGGDFVTKQPTAIAWRFLDWSPRHRTEVRALGESGNPERLAIEEEFMIDEFLEAYDRADIVTGHFIRGFDLPLISGAMLRLGMTPLLGDKLTLDTKLDLARASGLSKSQENLGAMFELLHPKVAMNTTLWGEANMLTKKGIKATKKRAIGDVEQHIELRARMLELGLLAPPRTWSAQASGMGNYHA